MRVGVISGSGTEQLPELTGVSRVTVGTDYGMVEVTRGSLAGVDVVHIPRHGPGHARLSSQVDHRRNLAALMKAGADCLISLTVCGAVDPTVALGSPVVFDDLYFPGNRLPDGTLCTWHTVAGEAGRGHWIFDRPFSEPLRQALVAAARMLRTPALTAGCYGHLDGPRFSSRVEIAALAGCGVVAVSQTAGPEVVLAGEAELPMALVGYITDHANGVVDTPQPVDDLLTRVRASTDTFTALLALALPGVGAVAPAGVVHRFDP